MAVIKIPIKFKFLFGRSRDLTFNLSQKLVGGILGTTFWNLRINSRKGTLGVCSVLYINAFTLVVILHDLFAINPMITLECML